MRRLTLAASLVLAVAVPGVAAAHPARAHQVPVRHGQPCRKDNGRPATFTLRMDQRAAAVIYAGTRHVSPTELRHLAKFARCQRNPANTPAAVRFNRTRAAAHDLRLHPPAPAMNYGVASWYALGGGGACGLGDVQSGYRVAHKTLACGTRVEICAARCATAIVSDRGPYVAGRDFDLNQNMRDATGCAGVCSIRWRTL